MQDSTVRWTSPWRQVPVAASRLQAGGDIDESYSGDRIGENKPIRPPFVYHGESWVSTGGMLHHWVEAYRLRLVTLFAGQASTFQAKVSSDHGATARADPLGFYHGILVRCRGLVLVLEGPPSVFVIGDGPEPGAQLPLFES